MQIQVIRTPLAQHLADAVVVPVFSGGDLAGPAADVDRAAGGLLKRLVDSKEISGRAFELTTLHSASGVKAPLLLVVGCGDRTKFDRAMVYRAASAAVRQLAGKARGSIAIDFGLLSAPLVESLVAGAITGTEGQDLYRADKKRHAPESIAIVTDQPAAVETGRILGESINLARRLVNEPPQEMYPESFARRADEVGRAAGLEVEVWDEKRLESERCGSLLAVGKGSTRPSRMVIVRHRGGAADAPWLALVGKGVTFDSGGLSLKPSDGMLTMKCDMAGAATVLGAMQAIGRLKLPVNVVGMMGLVENMPSGSAMKLGDVLTARNGRTIEVHNTDAEGRLVLADVLSVAVDREKAARIIDLATLTGACLVALGHDIAGLMTNDQAWCDTIRDTATELGEPVWQLPMYSDPRLTDFNEQIKSEVADIKNVGEGRWGGAITAAKFLEEFVSGTPWTHMDIAGPAFNEKPKPWVDAGASGMFVRTLVEIVRNS